MGLEIFEISEYRSVKPSSQSAEIAEGWAYILTDNPQVQSRPIICRIGEEIIPGSIYRTSTEGGVVVTERFVGVTKMIETREVVDFLIWRAQPELTIPNL